MDYKLREDDEETLRDTGEYVLTVRVERAGGLIVRPTSAPPIARC